MPTSTPQPPEEPVPFTRLLAWSAIALILVLGVWLYIKFGREVAPLIGA